MTTRFGQLSENGSGPQPLMSAAAAAAQRPDLELSSTVVTELIDRFSVHCREAFVAAEREARLLKHGHIGTEHVLLGLLRIEESVAAQALRLMGVTHRKARRAIVRLVDVGADRVEGRITFTPRVREVIEDAFTGSIWMPRLAKGLIGLSAPRISSTTPTCRPVSADAPRLSQGRVEVHTEQLLLALIAHGEGVAAHVLAQFGIDLEKAAVATTDVRFPRPLQALPVFDETERWPPAPPKAN
jgi:Clp amino terminal domain, pathogenicity island component